jgi:hypothetical protein
MKMHMKKSFVAAFVPLFILGIFLSGASTVHAIAQGQPCTGTVDSNECDGTLACINGTCEVDPNLDATPAAPTPATTPAASTQSTTAGANGGSTANNFIPLTSIPGVNAIANLPATAGLPAFFNQLYKICIGVCGALALFQIIRAGILYMSAGDNTEKVSQARQLISTSILGLVIVLSPVIVFSIINPSVLSLSVNFKSIAPTPTTGTAGAVTPASNPTQTGLGNVTNGTGAGTGYIANQCSKLTNGAAIASAQDQACCAAQTGCKVQLSFTNALNAPTCACSN